MLKSFKIKGLFGTTNVKIPFDKNGIKILIGENGLGKTTVLNILYNILNKNFSKLFEYDFKEIELVFLNDDKINLMYDNLIDYNFDGNSSRIYQTLEKNCSNNELLELVDFAKNNSDDRRRFIRHPIIRKNPMIRRYSPTAIFNALKSVHFSDEVMDAYNIIDENIRDIKILYFPTYRRIEEDLKNLNLYIDDEHNLGQSDKLIQFGMDDVGNHLEKIQEKIQRLSTVGLSKISSEILSQLVKGAPDIDESELDLMESESIEIILARVGSALSMDEKDRIIKMIENKKIKDENRFLVYFIKKLVEIYESQKKLDDKINQYIKVCNNYLSFSNKKIIYNESKVEFYIESKFFKGKKLLIDFLGNLSSGEKQILSLFSKIYLADESDNFIILFDEPELSLSVYWQELLLPDIVKSGKINNLIAVTHSPFIYDNELEKNSNALNEYITINGGDEY